MQGPQQHRSQQHGPQRHRSMKVLRRSAMIASLGLLVFTTGCPDARTSNQGGGTIISTATKLVEKNIGELTADEWQIAADNIPTLADFGGFDLGDYEIPEITDEQAQAIVDFLVKYNIKTIDDLLALDPASIVVPEVLQSLVDLFI